MDNLYIKSTDALFPKLVNTIDNKPEGLYFKGQTGVLELPCISVVGTRRPSSYGEYCCRKIIQEISEIRDVCIVSGLARGIDTIAHESALEFGLSTIAVLGSGFNNIYPRENKDLSERIMKNGAIISEYEADAHAKAMHFPLRNRIISGLSHGTIAIECPEKSGTLITIKYALEQNRACFCMAGDIDRENSIGTIRLLQRGEAYPIISGRDVIEYLRDNSFLFTEEIKEKKKGKIRLKDASENLVYSLLKFGRGVSASKLSESTGLCLSNLLSVISKLEIKGLISSRAGLYYKK